MDAVRLLGGPYGGAEFDLEELFGARRPSAFVITMTEGLAHYELDAAEPAYQFARLRNRSPVDTEPDVR